MVRKTLAIFASLVIAVFAAVPQTTNATPVITVITSDHRPVNAKSIDPGVLKILNLDAVQKIEEELSRNLPVNETEALVIAQQRIDKVGQDALNEKLKNAYGGILTAIALGVERYPAIIFENKFVVYGVTDIDVALEKYYVWSEKEINRRD